MVWHGVVGGPPKNRGKWSIHWWWSKKVEHAWSEGMMMPERVHYIPNQHTSEGDYTKMCCNSVWV